MGRNAYEMLGIAPPEAGQPQPGEENLSPFAREWMRINAAARQGKMPTGESITETLASPQMARGAAADVVRLGSGLVKTPALAVPLAGPVISGLTGAAGEGAAQLIEHGIIQDPNAMLFAGALPAAVTGGFEAAQRIPPAIGRRLPGAPYAIQQAAVEESRGIAAGVKRPPRPAAQVYDELEKLNPRIKAPNMRDAANDILLEEIRNPGSLQGPLKKVAEDIIDVYQQNQGEIPFQQLRAMQKRVGQRTGVIQGQEANELRGGYKHLFGAIEQDLDVAGSTPAPARSFPGSGTRASGLLREAKDAYRREKGIEKLAEVIESGVSKGRSDLEMTFNPAKPLNALDEARTPPLARAADDPYKYLRESFSPQELTEIQQVLLRLRGLPSLPNVGGQADTGSGRRIARLIVGSGTGTGIGAGVAHALGLPEAVFGPLGAAAGTVAMETAHTKLAEIVASPRGRLALLKLLQARGGVVDDRAMRVLAQSARAAAIKDNNLGQEGDERGQ